MALLAGGVVTLAAGWKLIQQASPGNRGDAWEPDLVADESDASFPASDPPSWTPTAGPGGKATR
jgi:hypothetical protein